jgi:hypothetical protein
VFTDSAPGLTVNKLLNPAYWARALSRPIVLTGLVIDLLPVLGVIVWGWGAAPLVLLYWLENVIAGVMTIPRLVISGASYGGIGLAVGAGLSAFFVFHYGMFCLVHGTFLFAFISMSGDTPFAGEDPFMDIFGMVGAALASAPHVDWMVLLIFAFQVLLFLNDFIIRGEWKNTNPMAEMMAPYGRIIVLHIGIFAGAGALFLLGQPMVGVLALIVFRAIWGIVTNSKSFGAEGELEKEVQKLSRRDQFEKMLRGQRPDAS